MATERTIVRGRRQTVAEARLPENRTGLEAQPARFTAGMWAVILFISSEAMFFSALFTTYFYLRARIPAWEPVFQRCVSADCEKPKALAPGATTSGGPSQMRTRYRLRTPRLLS